MREDRELEACTEVCKAFHRATECGKLCANGHNLRDCTQEDIQGTQASTDIAIKSIG